MPDPRVLPTILAVSFQGCREESNPHLRLWHVCDLADLWLRFAVMISLGELARGGTLPRGVAARVRTDLEQPTMWVWRNLASHVAAASAPMPALTVPELPGFVETHLVPLIDGTAEPRSVESSVSSLRNRLAHGGGITRVLAERLVALWVPRIELIMAAASWLGDLELLVPHGDGLGLLRGPSPTPQPVHGSAGTRRVLLRRGERQIVLHPLAVFSIPLRYAASMRSAQVAVPQVYLRRGSSHLEYTPLGSEELCESEADEATSAAFLELLGVPESVPPLAPPFAVKDFDLEIAREGALCIGREHEKHVLTELACSGESGLHFLSGSAGAGKSSVVAAFVASMRVGHPDVTLLAYRFTVGDERCSPMSFLQFLRERLRVLSGDGGSVLSRSKLHDEVDALLRAVTSSRRCVFVIDGLDELAATYPDAMAKTVLPLASAGGLWVCAGRPTPGLTAVLADAKQIFPGGELPRMTAVDVRGLLLHRLGPHRKRLLGSDVEATGHVVNAVVDRVTERADGLPIYVKHVIDDILGGWIVLEPNRLPDLPRSLAAYHERLLGRLGIGAIAMVITPTVATLSVLLEAVDEKEIGALLGEDGWDLLASDPDPDKLVRDAVAWLGPMLRGAPSASGGTRYSLFHHSLREHMETSATTRGPVQNARRKLLRQCRNPQPRGPLRAYLLRRGMRHLAIGNDLAGLHLLLAEPGYVSAKAEVQSLEDVLDDLLDAHALVGAIASEDTVTALMGLCNSLVHAGRFEVETLHALLTYRADRSIYEAFLARAKTEATIGRDPAERSRIATAFRARHANLARRSGELASAHAELLYCASSLSADVPNAEAHRELARVTYDLGYIAYLRGDASTAHAHLSESAAHAMSGGDIGGAWRARCVSTRIALEFETMTVEDLDRVLQEAAAVFENEAAHGNPTGERWLANVVVQRFDAAILRRDREEAARLLSALEGDGFIRRYGGDLMPPLRARLLALKGDAQEASAILAGYLLGPEGENLRSVNEEGLSRLFLELSRAREAAGDAEGARGYLSRALLLPDECGNTIWKTEAAARLARP